MVAVGVRLEVVRVAQRDAPWDQHRELLAQVLDNSTWDDLSSAYTSVKLFNDEQEFVKDQKGFRVPLHGDDPTPLRWTFEAFEHALATLYPHGSRSVLR